MRQTTGTRKSPGEKIVKDIKRATRKHYSSEEKFRIVYMQYSRFCRRVHLRFGKGQKNAALSRW